MLLVEIVAMLDGEDDFSLSDYNTLIYWIDIDQFLTRRDLSR